MFGGVLGNTQYHRGTKPSDAPRQHLSEHGMPMHRDSALTAWPRCSFTTNRTSIQVAIDYHKTEPRCIIASSYSPSYGERCREDDHRSLRHCHREGSRLRSSRLSITPYIHDAWQRNDLLFETSIPVTNQCHHALHLRRVIGHRSRW